MTYEYYFAIMQQTETGMSFTGVVYKLDYKLDSSENMKKCLEELKDEGYENAVILFYKELN